LGDPSPHQRGDVDLVQLDGAAAADSGVVLRASREESEEKRGGEECRRSRLSRFSGGHRCYYISLAWKRHFRESVRSPSPASPAGASCCPWPWRRRASSTFSRPSCRILPSASSRCAASCPPPC